MSDLRGYNNNLAPARNSGWIAARATQDGTLYAANYALAAAIEGRAFGCHWGTLTTPLTTPATQAITTGLPQAILRVPDGTVVIPLAVKIIIESCGATTQGEIAIGICSNDVGNGTSTAGTSTPSSLNTAAPVTSGCTQRQLVTTIGTAESGLLELKRFSFAASAVNQVFDWIPSQEGIAAVLRGAATLLIYIGGNAVVFYAQAQWIELPETAVS